MPFAPASRPLSAIEARVLGTLMEKARTVPDSYPLTLNSVVGGCNQKTAREPAMEIGAAEAQEALDELRRLTLVFESSGGRAARYEHNAERGIGIPGAAAALIGLLMLRGPQTAGELRIHAERWHRFADISSVEAFLDELAERSEDKGGPLVVRLPRAPGAREARWAHLLCGPVDAQALSAAPASDGGHAGASGGLAARLEALEAEFAALRAEVAELRAGCGA
ncbi:YceH family protein [uncultured Xylophilus sp.]|uniref:YceH family protein n=1 Tax=uncultured Xylophilus sp. TaxID=296832 RepID=UPI0025E927F6|nr:YceH family protein [uncultured Xylophilus sp.]